ncbi:MAG: DNA/RNA non-specific endonuclease, partial [Coraliomargarita sp.]
LVHTKTPSPRACVKLCETPAGKHCLAIWSPIFDALVLGLTYSFGSYSVRGKMEQATSSLLNTIRSSAPWPEFIESGLNALYDAVPHSEGLIVDGGELGHDGSPLLAGIPISKKTVRILNNKSCVNVFSPQLRSSLCLAYHLNGEGQQSATIPTHAFDDARFTQLSSSQMRSGKWQPRPLVHPVLLQAEFGQTGCNESMLSTQLSPMRAEFADGLWQALTEELFAHYPKRFGELWVYVGPIYNRDSLILSSGLKVPSAYYAIAFDLTETGGLRAIAFMVPNDAGNNQLENYISSIGSIEQATGMNFMPDIEFDARETLRTWQSPRLW